MAKEPKPRQNKRAPDRQAAVPARSSTLYLNRQDFLTVDGKWDREKFQKATAQYPGKDLVLKDNSGSGLFLPASKYQNRDGGGPNENAWKQYKKDLLQAKTVNFYDDRIPTSGEKTVAPRIVRVHTDAATIKRDWIEQPKTSFGERLTAALHVAEAVRKKSPKAKKIADKPAPKPKPPKKVVKRARHTPHGAQFEGRLLGKNQRIARSGRAYYMSPARIAERAAARKNRLALIKQQTKIRLKAKIAAEKLRAKTKARKQKQIVARRRAHTKAYFAAKPQIRARQAAAKVVAFTQKLRKLPGYGKTPVKLLLQQNGMSRPAPGKRAVMSAMTHAEKYPARNLAGQRAFSASAIGRQTVSSVGRPYMGSLGNMVGAQTLRPSVRGASMFATSQTLSTEKFPQGGAGILFRIDAAHVIANLTGTLPLALQRGMLKASDSIGRKMLDIIEPYVPKDTGLLYSSAATNVSQTAMSLVDMSDGEAYPSGQMFGVSISYNAPYAELVYFNENEDVTHGQAYNDKHGTSEKGEKETARWIEAAFEHEKGAWRGLLAEYARAVTIEMSAAGVRPAAQPRGPSGRFAAW